MIMIMIMILMIIIIIYLCCLKTHVDVWFIDTYT